MDKLKWQNALDANLEDKHGRSLPSDRAINSFARRLLGWYTKSGRKFPWRKSRLPIYEVVITEALLQRTRADVVAKFLPIFLGRYPDWQTIANTSASDLECALEPIGLQKRRASTLKELAGKIIERGGRLPTNPLKLSEMPGIGQYLFYAINLYRRNAPMPLLDAGMARVLERHFGPRILVDIRYDPYLQQLAHKVVAAGDSKLLNWAILDLSALVCSNTKPQCENCPVASSCLFQTSVD